MMNLKKELYSLKINLMKLENRKQEQADKFQ